MKGLLSLSFDMKNLIVGPFLGNHVNLRDWEPEVVTSLVKLYLRELPDNVLTTTLAPKFAELPGEWRLVNKKHPVLVQLQFSPCLESWAIFPFCFTFVSLLFVSFFSAFFPLALRIFYSARKFMAP